MRYLVIAQVKPGQEKALRQAIETGTLGLGSVAGGEYLRDMAQARLFDDGSARWVEVCYCHVPLDEERAYWERYFDLLSIKDAHARRNCRHETGEECWACSECNCTAKLEAYLAERGRPFQDNL